MCDNHDFGIKIYENGNVSLPIHVFDFHNLLERHISKDMTKTLRNANILIIFGKPLFNNKHSRNDTS